MKSRNDVVIALFQGEETEKRIRFDGKKARQLTTQQHVNTIAKPQMAPAVPTTHVKRMNNITPKMF